MISLAKATFLDQVVVLWRKHLVLPSFRCFAIFIVEALLSNLVPLFVCLYRRDYVNVGYVNVLRVRLFEFTRTPMAF